MRYRFAFYFFRRSPPYRPASSQALCAAIARRQELALLLLPATRRSPCCCRPPLGLLHCLHPTRRSPHRELARCELSLPRCDVAPHAASSLSGASSGMAMSPTLAVPTARCRSYDRHGQAGASATCELCGSVEEEPANKWGLLVSERGREFSGSLVYDMWGPQSSFSKP